jgi:hypothetical protein
VRLLAALLLALALGTASCGNAGSLPAEPAIEVTAITSPLASGEPSPFLLVGSGFLALVGEPVVVTFTAERGARFGSSTSASVVAFVESPTLLSGTSPASTSPEPFDAWVRVTLSSGANGQSATPIARFEPAPPKAAVVLEDPSLREAR